ncbi:MAG: hypothetical protein KC431_00130, partial [Myxococcales bacterium]|nr:hypothetical protein [Myxococcales bacterium]
MTQGRQPARPPEPSASMEGERRLDPTEQIKQRERDLRQPLKDWVIPFALVGGAASLFFGFSVIVDVALSAPPTNTFSISGLLHSLFSQDPAHASNTLGSLGEVMAAVL